MSKEKIIKNTILTLISIFAIVVLFYLMQNTRKESYVAKSEETLATAETDVRFSNAQSINVEKIIDENTKDRNTHEEITSYEEELEYLTKYRKSDYLYEGTTNIVQEGRNGI